MIYRGFDGATRFEHAEAAKTEPRNVKYNLCRFCMLNKKAQSKS